MEPLTYRPAENDEDMKLMVLFAIARLKVSATYTRIFHVLSAAADVSYCLLTVPISDLIESGNIEELHFDDQTVFSLTKQGSETLSYFEHRILRSVRLRMLDEIDKINKEVLSGNKLDASIVPVNEEEYLVKAEITENKVPVLKFEMYVGDKERAKKIVRNFKEHTSLMYLQVVKAIDFDYDKLDLENMEELGEIDS
ncbi:MAG: DUF4364 family protein [Clostridia bacterium]|nr:DUF4364 family protein [Clostridia bacterium]